MIREKFSTQLGLLTKATLILTFVLTSCVDSEISKTENSISSSGGDGTLTKTISGVAINIQTGQPFSNTWLCLEDGTTCTQTDEDGAYTFEDITYGEHTITPHDSDGGDILKYDSDDDGDLDENDSDFFGIKVTVNDETPETGIDINSGDSQRAADSITILTKWSTEGLSGNLDIDAHLLVPLNGDCNSPDNSDDRYFEDGSSNPFVILDFISRLTGESVFDLDASPFVSLDLDDRGVLTDGNDHMETMYLKLNSDGTTKCNGTYKFYVNNFDADALDNDNFPDVSIVVIKGQEVIAEYESSDTTGNKFWNVFSVNSSGELTSINEYVDDCGDSIPEINNGTGFEKCSVSTN